MKKVIEKIILVAAGIALLQGVVSAGKVTIEILDIPEDGAERNEMMDELTAEAPLDAEISDLTDRLRWTDNAGKVYSHGDGNYYVGNVRARRSNFRVRAFGRVLNADENKFVRVTSGRKSNVVTLTGERVKPREIRAEARAARKAARADRRDARKARRAARKEDRQTKRGNRKNR